MFYPQTVEITLLRPGRGGVDLERLKAEAALAFPELLREATILDNILKVDRGVVGFRARFESNGGNLYNPTSKMFFGIYQIQKISSTLCCQVLLNYEGSDRMDAERIEIDQGKIVSHKKLAFVLVKDVEEVNARERDVPR